MLRKNVDFNVCGKNIVLPINFLLIDSVEEVYDMNVDYVVGILMKDFKSVKISKLSQLIYEFVKISGQDLKEEDVKNCVYNSNPTDLRKYIGLVQSVCLYMRKYITDEEMDTLLEGKDIEDDNKKNDIEI